MRVVRLALVGALLGGCAGACTAFAVALLRARRPTTYAQHLVPPPIGGRQLFGLATRG